MTDKEKLDAIRAEIHRLVDVRGYNREMANDLFAFMDSLPNEPVSIWHDASEKSNEPEEVVIINPSDNTGEVLTKCISVYQGRIWAYTSDLLKLDNSCKIGKNLQEEPVSEDLENDIDTYLATYFGGEKEKQDWPFLKKMAIHFAEWQKEKEYTCYEEAFEDGATWKVENLWKSADGDDLPEIDREVIALLDNGRVVFAHRPPEYWDGKNIVTGKVTRYYPKTYDKGGWNQPDVKYWLDCQIPNMGED